MRARSIALRYIGHVTIRATARWEDHCPTSGPQRREGQIGSRKSCLGWPHREGQHQSPRGWLGRRPNTRSLERQIGAETLSLLPGQVR